MGGEEIGFFCLLSFTTFSHHQLTTEMQFFTQIHKDKHASARAGIIQTAHGAIETPIFMPVGTQATVKTLDTRDIQETAAQIILANTYHLHLRPGEELIDSFGGLHTFMQWDGPILTDSGGFQVFSLGKGMENSNHENLVEIDDTGVTFASHIDGSRHRFTPEIAIDIQHKLGADIIMAFDECTPDNADTTYAKEALERTHRWAAESLAAHKKETARHGYEQKLFGIIQGATHKELRIESAKAITGMDFDGIAIGGESVGFNMAATRDILTWVGDYLPENKPRYTMGVGHMPQDLFEVVEYGIDMFDCVSPTRIARNGTLFAHPSVEPSGKITITNSRFKNDENPIDPIYTHPGMTGYSRAYLHHLFKAKEMLGFRLATMHNLYFLLQLMKDMRVAIMENRFLEMKKEWTRK